MNVAIVGYAREGRAAYEHWGSQGHNITICDADANKQIPHDAQAQLGSDYLHGLDRFDIIVRTAGLHPQKLVEGLAEPATSSILNKVTTNVNEFFRVCPTRNIIGVTGTKGKGTTSTLIARMFEAAGFRVHLGGNIGIPALELLKNDIQPDDWVVLELSSFQLMDIRYSPHIAMCVMMSEDHLNWHQGLDEYILAKQQLFRWQKPDDIAIYYGTDSVSKRVTELSPAQHIPYMTAPGAEVLHDKRIVLDGAFICNTSDIKLIGKHNWQNICGALTAVWQITHDATALRQAVVNMTALPHRLEPVREVNGVMFYNDSFSSAPGSAVAAIHAISGPKVLILGGIDRGLNLGELASTVSAHKDNLRKVLVIGQIAPRLQKELQHHGFDNFEVLKHMSMQDIVERAIKTAQPGDSILLSPGASSFDMFKDFEDRGNQFKDAVNSL